MQSLCVPCFLAAVAAHAPWGRMYEQSEFPWELQNLVPYAAQGEYADKHNTQLKCLILITCDLPGAVALPGVYADFQPQGQLLLPDYQEPLGGPSEYTVASKQGITPASLPL